MPESKTATVVSRPSPLWYHSYRASANFIVSARAKYLCFKVVNHPNASSICFKVMKDVRFWDQPWKIFNDIVIYEDVRSGSRLPVNTEGGLYIANPRGAHGKDFTVEIYEGY